MERVQQLRRRIRLWTGLFMIGLFLSGATAIPLEWELDTLSRIPQIGNMYWIHIVRHALHETNTKFPFVAYGFDWLAFGHFAIAIAFIGALRNPARNVWLFQFGMIACALVVPYAFVFGALRGIPIYWRLIDCSFGVFGIIPLWFCNRWASELQALSGPRLD